MFKTLHSKPNDWNQKNITQDYVWFSRRLSFYLREKCQGMWRVAVMPPSIKTRVGWYSREGFNAHQGRQTHIQLVRAWTNKYMLKNIIICLKVEIIFISKLVINKLLPTTTTNQMFWHHTCQYLTNKFQASPC